MKITRVRHTAAVFGVVTVACFVAGLALFSLAEKKAKSSGLLGQYSTASSRKVWMVHLSVNRIHNQTGLESMTNGKLILGTVTIGQKPGRT